MTLALVIRSVFEFAAVVLAIAGFIKREELLDFENKLFRAIGIHWRNYRRRRQYEKKHSAREIQSRAPADLPEEEIAVTVVSAPVTIHRVA